MKKMLFTSVCLLGLLGLSACGSSNETAGASGKSLPDLGERYKLDEKTPAWKLDTKDETTKITWYLNADWWVNLDNYGKNMITKQFQEDLNIDVEFITGDDTKLNTMFASGDMPDIITLDNMTTKTAKTANTWAYALDDLAKKYDPFFFEAAFKDTLDWYQLEDGKSYGYSNYSNTKEDYDNGYVSPTTAFIIRKDVYEELGKPSMKTPEEFLDVMAQIKEKFPDLYGMGFNSVIASSSAIGNALQDYLGVPVTDEEGNFYNRNLDEDYLAWVKTLQQAHSQGAISDDTFADDTTGFDEKVKTGKYATILMDGTPSQAGNLQAFKDANPGNEYIAIDGPASTVGNKPQLKNSGLSGWMSSYITNKAKDPAKCIQMFTYLLSDEGQLLMNYGIEGETFEYDADGKIVMAPEVKALQESGSKDFDKQYGLGQFFIFGNDRYKAWSAEDSTPGAIKQFVEWGKDKIVPSYEIENVGPDAGSTESRNSETIQTEWNKDLVSMIRAKSDKEYDQYLANYKDALEKNDWAGIQKIANKKIADNKEKLGLE
ncbi:sugar ABC transporter substrate-binding protein [Enterococcus sp.]|uniref:sugar ABC transporter substrate-binding protein n=1 Tax=Enterococcus sp. TaxID=35783 RepID=UPI003C771712